MYNAISKTQELKIEIDLEKVVRFLLQMINKSYSSN